MDHTPCVCFWWIDQGAITMMVPAAKAALWTSPFLKRCSPARDHVAMAARATMKGKARSMNVRVISPKAKNIPAMKRMDALPSTRPRQSR